MKSPISIFITLLLVSILLLFSSCRKEDKPPIYLAGDTTYGFATMKKNGYDMMASGRGQYIIKEFNEKTIGISFSTYDENGLYAEGFSFGSFPLSLEQFNLCNFIDNECVYKVSYSTSVEDILEDVYQPVENMDNYLEITDIDEESGWIKGKFQIFMELDHRKPKTNPDNPDRVAFTDGYFEVKLVE
jgi:hypothetical protein